jgi:hypothetical protein
LVSAARNSARAAGGAIDAPFSLSSDHPGTVCERRMRARGVAIFGVRVPVLHLEALSIQTSTSLTPLQLRSFPRTTDRDSASYYFRADGTFEWHIDKRIRGIGRISGGTGTSDRQEAERYLPRKIEVLREAAVYGKRPRRKFREAATRYLNEFAWKRSIERDARALKALDPFIGDVWLDCVHNESFKAFIDARHRHPAPDCKRVAAGTINRDLAVARRILNLSARLWRDEGSTLTWLAESPLIQLLENRKARKPYPIDWSEQQLLFSELTQHLRRAALFKVNTGMREKEVCQLRWEWEQRVPELDTP